MALIAVILFAGIYLALKQTQRSAEAAVLRKYEDKLMADALDDAYEELRAEKRKNRQ